MKRMRRGASRSVLIALLSAMAFGAGPVWAAEYERVDEHRAGAGTMVVDLVVARPLGVVTTVLGTAAFVVASPFALLGGNLGETGEALVLGPARETFARCLGCPGRERSDPLD